MSSRQPESNSILLEKFLSLRRAEGLREATLTNQRSICRSFFAAHPDFLQSPRQAALDFLTAARRPWSRHTRNKILRQFFEFLRCEGVLDANPLQGVKNRTPSRTAKCPSPETIKKLLDSLDKTRFAQRRLYVMLLTALDTGMRRGELVGIRGEDVDFDLCRIRVRADSSKSGRDRLCPIGAETAEELRKLLRHRLPGWTDTRVFLTEEGKPVSPTHFARSLARAAHAAGVRIGVHSLRHYFAQTLLRATGNLALTSRALGHAGIRVTADYYGHINYEDVRAAHDQAAPVRTVLIPKEPRLRKIRDEAEEMNGRHPRGKRK